MTSGQEAPYKATNCGVKISHSSGRPDINPEGQSMEDNQIQTSPYPTQVKIQKQKGQTYGEIYTTDKQDISRV
jgi:hypothetical protein